MRLGVVGRGPGLAAAGRPLSSNLGSLGAVAWLLGFLNFLSLLNIVKTEDLTTFTFNQLFCSARKRTELAIPLISFSAPHSLILSCHHVPGATWC